MTTDELIEWHTKHGHWRFLTVEEDRQNRDDPIGITHDSWVQKLGFFPSVRRSHPFPATLDAAAKALREPWTLAKVTHYGSVWSCHIERFNPTCQRMILDAPDERTARYRAAVAAEMEDGE